MTQIERLVHEGLFFGYRVRTFKTEQQLQQERRSGSLVNSSVSQKNQKSIACDKFPQDRVQEVIGEEIQRVSGFVADQTTPHITSSCIYKAKKGGSDARSVLILYRELENKEVAQKNLEAIKQSKRGEAIKNLADGAYFNTQANQLTLLNKNTLITITVPNNDAKKVSTKDLARNIANIALN